MTMPRTLVGALVGSLVASTLGACSKPTEPAATPPTHPATPPTKAADALPAAGIAPPTTEASAMTSKLFDIPLHTLTGAPTTLGAFKGKAVLVVNVASKCGLTPQYSTLEALQHKYGDLGFTVVGFPCNQFGGQEPGTAAEIQTFCSTKYGVSFPLMEKIDVNGAARSPIYSDLTTLPDVGGYTGDIRWNFEKFVISADGSQVTRFEPQTKPDDPTVIAAIEAALPKK